MKLNKQILAIIAVCGLMACSSNSDIDEGYVPQDQIPNTGAPVITAVYDAGDKSLTMPLTEAEPGQNVCIVGRNLNFIKSLKFNMVEADLSKTYTMSTQAIVQVPMAFSHERVNTIEYTTDMGTASYTFVITLPAMQVYSLDNEFQAPGQVVTITGDNFDYYGFGESGTPASVQVGGQTVALTGVSPQALKVRVPTGVSDNTTITVNWQDAYGTMQKVSLPFRPTAGLLFVDMSKAQRDRTDGCVTIEDDSQVTSAVSALGTPHLHFAGTLSKYAWVELSFSQNLPDVGDASKVNDYNFVFEVLTASGKPLAKSGYEFAWNWDWNNSYAWNPNDGSGWDTAGQWMTVRLPLAEVAPKGIGTVGEWMTLNIGFQPTEKYSADFRFGNFRIQKKQ